MSLYRPGSTFSRRNSPLSPTVAFRPPRNSWWTSQKPSGRSGSERDATRVTSPVAGSPVGSTRRPAIVPPVSKATTIASLFRSGTRIVLVAYPSLRTRIHLSPLRARSSNLPWSSVWATPPIMAPFGPSSPSTSTVAATTGVPSLASVTCPERLRPRSSPASATNASTTPPQDATARTAPSPSVATTDGRAPAAISRIYPPSRLLSSRAPGCCRARGKLRHSTRREP